MPKASNISVGTYVLLAFATVLFGSLGGWISFQIIELKANAATFNGRLPEVIPSDIVETISYVIALIISASGAFWAIWQCKCRLSCSLSNLLKYSLLGWLFFIGLSLLIFSVSGVLKYAFSNATGSILDKTLGSLFGSGGIIGIAICVLLMLPGILCQIRKPQKEALPDDFDHLDVPPLK